MKKLELDITKLQDESCENKCYGYEYSKLASEVSGIQKELKSLKHKDTNKERERNVEIQDILTDLKETINILSNKKDLSNSKINRIRKVFRKLKRFDEICKFTNTKEFDKVKKLANSSKDTVNDVLTELCDDMIKLLGKIHSKMEAYYTDDADSDDLYSDDLYSSDFFILTYFHFVL